MDMGGCLEDLLKAMDDKYERQENRGNPCRQCDMMMMKMSMELLGLYAYAVRICMKRDYFLTTFYRRSLKTE